MDLTLALYKRLHKRMLDASTWFFRHTRMVTRTVPVGPHATPTVAGANLGRDRPLVMATASISCPGRARQPIPCRVDGA